MAVMTYPNNARCRMCGYAWFDKTNAEPCPDCGSANVAAIGETSPTQKSALAPKAAPTKATAPRGDWTLALGKFGVILALLPFGALFWAVNGGFSVLGLGVIAAAFNSAGALAWAALSSIQFRVPVVLPGLPSTQPLVPWGAVAGATILQIVVVWRKLRGKTIPVWLLAFAILLSLYDLATTFFGLGTVEWIMRAGFLVQAPLAVLLTFALETTIGFLLRR